MRKLLIAGLLACTCLPPAMAVPLAYDEETDGDLQAGAGFTLPVLPLDVGTNTVKGTVRLLPGGDSDSDFFAFSVPAGTVLVSGGLTAADSAGDVTTIAFALYSGTSVVGTGAFIGNLVVSPPGSIALPDLPLASGTYHLDEILQAGSGIVSYTFQFDLRALDTPVPAPAPAVLLSAGLASLGLARRWRSA